MSRARCAQCARGEAAAGGGGLCQRCAQVRADVGELEARRPYAVRAVSQFPPAGETTLSRWPTLRTAQAVAAELLGLRDAHGRAAFAGVAIVDSRTGDRWAPARVRAVVA